MLGPLPRLVALAGQALGNPMGVVLPEQPLAGVAAASVGLRIAPAIKEIATSSALATAVAGGLGN